MRAGRQRMLPIPITLIDSDLTDAEFREQVRKLAREDAEYASLRRPPRRDPVTDAAESGR